MRKKITSKKTTTSQGIGFIRDASSLIDLAKDLGEIFLDGFIQSTERTVQINHIKSRIDQLVGRNRANFTKTDVYQVLYLLVLGSYKDKANEEIKLTKANTIVAKLSTEGQYGNTGVVRRQTTLEKFGELFRRIMGGPTDEARLRTFATNVYNGSLNDTQKVAFWGMVGPENVGARGRTGTRTERVSNRTRRTTTPRATTTPSTPAPTSTQRYVVTDSGIIPAPRTSGSGELTELSDDIKRDYVRAWLSIAVGVNPSFIQVGEITKTKQMGYFMLAFRFLMYLRIKANPQNERIRDGYITMTFSEINRIAVTDATLNFDSNQVKDLDKRIQVVAFILARYKINAAKKLTYTLRGIDKRTISSYTISIAGSRSSATIDNMVYSAFYNDVGVNSYAISTINAIRSTRGASRESVLEMLGEGRTPKIPKMLLFSPYITSTVTTTPTATVTDRTPPGFGPDVTQESFRQTTPTPTPTPPPPAPPPAPDVLIRNMKITDAFDFGIEWEHFGLGFPKLKRTMAAIGQPLYPEYYPYHDLSDYIKKGMFPDGKINKGWWVMQVDGSLSADYNEPASEFRNTKQEAMVRPRDAWRDHDTYKGELVSPVLGGKRGLAIIKLVGNALVNAGMRHNPTMGMHTHVTKKGFNRTNIKKLMYNYTVMEPLIESMMEPNRRSTAPRQYNKSNFDKIGLTLRSSQSTVIEKCKSQILNLSDDDFYYKWGSSKKQAVNLLPFYGGNTIEFRQQGANFEADSVTMWIAFLFYLCEFSKTKTFKECQWNNLIAIMPVGLASFWYNRIQDLTGKSPYELSFQKN